MKHHLCPPELKLATILFGLAICLCSCSSSYTVRSTSERGAYTYGEINEELKGRHAKIELRDGKEIFAKEVRISDDSVSWLDARTDKQSGANIGQLNKIVIKNYLLGGLEGLGFGVVGGGGVGALVGQVTVGNDGDWGTGAGAVVGLILGGGTGTIVGLITGLIIGHSYNYEFPSTEQSDSLQNGK